MVYVAFCACRSASPPWLVGWQEVLFKHFDADDSGTLEYAEAQKALQFLSNSKEPATVAFPPDAYDAKGVLKLPKSWFFSMYRAME